MCATSGRRGDGTTRARDGGRDASRDVVEATSDDILAQLRAARGFDPKEVADAKVGRLLRWLGQENLDAVVVGVSGGVDSALVVALLLAAAAREASPLRRVVALLLPIGGRGATRQEEATARGRQVAEALGAKFLNLSPERGSNPARAQARPSFASFQVWEAPLTDALAATVGALARGSGLAFDAWSEGQCLSVVRTPALYGAAALLQAHGFRAVVAGTTNRDEGAYLGFFGKASDGMVDVQLISDLHKSEVRALARYLGVPAEVVDAVPRGDVHDGRTDEEMIGASYDEVETFSRLRELGRDPTLAGEKAALAIERLHAQNRHKYVAGSPAIHLDVMPRGVPGGAVDVSFAGRMERRPPPGALPGEWDPPPIALAAVAGLPRWEAVGLPHGFAIRIRAALGAADCERLREAMARAGCAEPVGVTGIRDGYGIGSMRATAWSPELASALCERIRPALPSVRFLDERSFTDAFATDTREGHRSWRLVGMSPLLRFMRYSPGGRHLCHYDAGYDYGDGRRTLLSVVFYLSDAPASGATRFVRDGQELMRSCERSFDDWARDTRDDEVIASVRPVAGDVLVFDHRVCHDVERWDGPGDRVIIRADVVYEAIGDGRLP